jgi:hypothetical protein
MHSLILSLTAPFELVLNVGYLKIKRFCYRFWALQEFVPSLLICHSERGDESRIRGHNSTQSSE